MSRVIGTDFSDTDRQPLTTERRPTLTTSGAGGRAGPPPATFSSMDLATLITTGLAVGVPIFVAMDPISALPLIVAWTRGMPASARRRQLRDALLTAFFLSLAFAIGGLQLLGVLGVDVADFQVAGGLVLLVLAISDLVLGGGHELRGTSDHPDFGVVPIGTPILAGPATLTTLLVLVDRFGLLLTSAALLITLIIAAALFGASDRLTSLLGRGGVVALSKVVSLLLAAIAVKYVRDGVMLMVR